LVFFLSALAGAGAANAQDPFGMLEAYGAMSAQAQYASDLHSRYSNTDDDDERPSRPPAPGLTREEANALQAAMREQEARDNAEFERWRNGYWQFFQSRDPAAPGQFCAAMFQNPQGMITLTGLDETWDGALLMFTGENVPSPRRFREITATLTQTGDPPVSLRVFNHANDPGMNGLGTLVFAVPNMTAALDSIADEQEFAVSVNGREVFRMAWKDGLSAVQGIRRCLGRG
jgi:hypothetical protein